jgi:hypothetical protein
VGKLKDTISHLQWIFSESSDISLVTFMLSVVVRYKRTKRILIMSIDMTTQLGVAVRYICRMSQEERSIFWDVVISVILSKKLYMNMCPIPNGFRDRAI